MSAANPFEGRTTTILGAREVLSLISMEETLEVQRRAFLAQARGRVTASPNAWLRLPEQERRRGWIKVLAGHEADSGSLGVKVLARFADNPPGANLGSLVLLFDDDNGFPLAIMDGVIITALRTGAGAGLATESLAADDATSVGLVGTGVVAWHSLEAIVAVRPSVRTLTVYSRSEQRRVEFADRAREQWGLQTSAVTTVDEATSGADIVITATNAPDPVVTSDHLTAGQHVNAMGIRTEIAPEALAKAWVIADGVDECISDGKFSTAIAAGHVGPEDLGPELGVVLADPSIGHDPGRISLFDSSGVAVQDVTMAQRIYELARERGVGTQIDLGFGVGAL